MSKQLTLKRRRFIDLYTNPENQECYGNGTRSVELAYPNIKTEKGRGVMATRLLGSDRIRDEVEKALEKKGITPEIVIGKFQTIADEAKYDRDKISAWRNVADIAGYTRKEPTVVIGQQALFMDEERREMEGDARRVIEGAEEEQKQTTVSLPRKNQGELSTEKQTNTGEDSLPPAKTNACVEGAD